MEILAPAGSPEALRAAVYAGADAVYLGGDGFNARAFARGVGDLGEAVSLAHLYGVDVHFALNTVVLDRETDAFLEQARRAADAGADAFIVADLGAFRILRSCFPSVPVHASTQLSIRNASEARAYAELGFSRLILARELSAEEVAKICRAVPVDVEVFAHGAVCACASGQCLMSSLIGGRSANRGQCAQPCRQKYSMDGRDGYFLNTRDLCLADRIQALRDAGVASIKIEGRMKNALYVAAAVRAYREAVDTGGVSHEAREALLSTFSRGGFTAGSFGGGPAYFPAFPGHTGTRLGTVLSVRGSSVRLRSKKDARPGDMVAAAGADKPARRVLRARRTSPDVLELELSSAPDLRAGDELYRKTDGAAVQRLRSALREPPPIPLRAEFAAEAGVPARLTVRAPGGRTVEEAGPVPDVARDAPLTAETARAQIAKTGGTPFAFSEVRAVVGDGIRMPASAINRMRRDALEAAGKALSRRYGDRFAGAPPSRPPAPGKKRPGRLAALVRTPEQARACAPYADILYVPWTPEASAEGPEVRPVIPPLQSDAELERRPKMPSLTGCLLPDMRGMIADSSFNVCNSAALEQLADMGAARVVLSQELNASQIRDLAVPEGLETEVVVYGYQTLMITELCPVSCGEEGCAIDEREPVLADRAGREFRLIREAPGACRVRILNALPLYAADILNEIRADVARLEFTVETPEECGRVARTYREALNGARPGAPETEFTRGHLRRGIQ